MTTWSKEDIFGEDRVFMRVHLDTFRCKKEQVPPSGVFKNHDGGMSVDWEKYATAEMTQEGSSRHPKTSYGVIAMAAGSVREVHGQTVEHEPLPENRAHAEVLGEKDEEVRVLLRRCSTWVIPPNVESA